MNYVENIVDTLSNNDGKKTHKSGLARKIIMLSLLTVILLALIGVAA
jgi:hypothetical protein